MQIKALHAGATWRDFHRAPHYVYQNDPYWVAQLETDVENVFSSKGNKIYDAASSKCWILFSAQALPIGRIAAFVDKKRNDKNGTRIGGIGFFECINNDEAANLLFEAAEQFLIAQGMTAIDGPINYGERDKFWGLLNKGWYSPLYHENYNPHYYLRFFEQHGYLQQEQIFTFGGPVTRIPVDRNHNIATRVRKRYNVQSRKIRKHNLRGDAAHIATVYNNAFKQMPHFKALSDEQVYKMFKPMKPVMDPKMVVISFAGDEPVGFCALMPDLNPMLKFTKGRLDWWKLPRFLWQLKFGTGHDVKGVAFGIAEDYQRRGIFAEMVDYLATLDNGRNLKHYRHLGLATIRGSNLPMVKSAAASLDSYIERVHISYRKILDDATHEPYDFMDVSDVPMGQIPADDIYPTH